MLASPESQLVEAIDPTELRRIAVGASRIPSYPPPGGTELELARFFAGELQDQGFEVELQEVEPSRPNVVARLRGGADGATVLFNGHLDTDTPAEGWTREPYGGTVEGNMLYGHGIPHMKASNVAMVCAAAALAQCRRDLQGDLVVSLVVGETRGGQGTRHMLRQGIRADYFIVGEPTNFRVMTFHAGVCHFRIILKGKRHHFSLPGKADNVIEIMMEILRSLGSSQVTISENGWLRRTVDKPEYRGLPRFNLGAIKGGLTEECLDWRPYYTPDYCAATLDFRYSPGLRPEDIQVAINAVIQGVLRTAPDVSAAVEPLDFRMPPLEVPEDHLITRTVLTACRDVLGYTPDSGAIDPLKFRSTDAGQLHEAGIPGVICGVGVTTGGRPDESVDLGEIAAQARIYALATYRLIGQPTPRLEP